MTFKCVAYSRLKDSQLNCESANTKIKREETRG